VRPVIDPILRMTLILRGSVGGLLMGLANLVPGISGGTMLLAAGIYPDFIEAVADVTTFRFRRRALLVLATVVGTAVVAILLLAGAVRSLVIDHRWVMYSLFIGLTLGGVPLVWRLARPATPAVFAGAAGGFLLMLIMAGAFGEPSGGGDPNVLILGVAGAAGASAMILPGVSGGYLLLLLGQYEVILGGVDQLKTGLLGDHSAGTAADLGVAVGSLHIIIPVAIGVAVGVAGVSNLLQWLLHHHEKPTLGALLGLLVGAVVGLWPFQQGVAPVPGDTLRGVVVTAEQIAGMDPADWPVSFFRPEVGQVLGAVVLVIAGLSVTLFIDHLSRGRGTAADRGSPAAGSLTAADERAGDG
jgi:putative membrane protein